VSEPAPDAVADEYGESPAAVDTRLPADGRPSPGRAGSLTSPAALRGGREAIYREALEAIAEIVEGFNFIAGYTYDDSPRKIARAALAAAVSLDESPRGEGGT